MDYAKLSYLQLLTTGPVRRMPLKAYHKSTSSYAAVDLGHDYFIPQVITPVSIKTELPHIVEEEGLNMWQLMASSFEGLKTLVASSSAAGLLIPAVLIAGGIAMIIQQFSPTLSQTIRDSMGYYSQGTAQIVQDSYIAGRLKYVSNPGSDYFQQLTDAAFSLKNYVPDTDSGNYEGTLYLSIPSLGFNRLPITANVESGTKEVYDQILQNSLAHFKGTSLPFSDNASNIVVYGHSASGSYQPTPTDPMAAFSFLSDLKVGDEIILEMNGEQYRYRMTRSKIVDPDDVSIISGTPGKESLTLFTCYPPGNNSKRIVTTAMPIN